MCPAHSHAGPQSGVIVQLNVYIILCPVPFYEILTTNPKIMFGADPTCIFVANMFGDNEKKYQLFCPFGALKKSPKELPNGQANAQRTKLPERAFDLKKKNGFLDVCR